MTKFHFFKMEGLGNDFVLFDRRSLPSAPFPLLLEKNVLCHIANRRFGIGCDQIILLSDTKNGKSPHFIRFFNADGTEAGACGNGSRCILRYLESKGVKDLSFETSEGLITGHVSPESVSVILPKPTFQPEKIPMRSGAKNEDFFTDLQKTWEKSAACAVGNPHASLFFKTPSLAKQERSRLGALLEKHADFPERVNIGCAFLDSPQKIQLFVWERGAGATLACGTAACAAAINAIRLNLAKSPVEIVMEGGKVSVAWQGGAKDPVTLTGPANFCFEGEIDLSSFTKA